MRVVPPAEVRLRLVPAGCGGPGVVRAVGWDRGHWVAG